MKKSLALKKAVVALLIFGLLAFFCWAVMYAVMVFGTGDFNFIRVHAEQVIAVLGFTVAPLYLPLSITNYVIIALNALLFCIMLSLCIIFRRYLLVFASLILHLVSIPFIEMISNLTRYSAYETTQQFGYIGYIESKSMSKTILVVCFIVVVFLALLVALSGYLVAFIYTIVNRKNYRVKLANPEKRARKLQDSKVNPIVEGMASGTPAFEEEPEPEPEPEPVPEEPAKDPKEELKEMIREIIREELGYRNAPQQGSSSVTGATFGGPLIVQYFNGLTQPQTTTPVEQPKPEPVPEPEPEEEPQEEPVVEEAPTEEPQPVEEQPVEEPVEEPVVEEPVPEAPAEDYVPVVETAFKEPEEKKPIIRIPFEERLLASEKELQENYNELKNEIMAYGVKSRVSNSGDTFRLHRKTFVKLTIAGKSLKLYFALDPKDYQSTTFPVQDASEKNIYAEIPLVFKVKSALSMKRCKQLIFDVMSKNDLVQGEIGKVNWTNEIAAALKEGKKAENAENEEDDDE